VGYVTTKSIGRAWAPATTAAGPTTTQQGPNSESTVPHRQFSILTTGHQVKNVECRPMDSVSITTEPLVSEVSLSQGSSTLPTAMTQHLSSLSLLPPPLLSPLTEVRGQPPGKFWN